MKKISSSWVTTILSGTDKSLKNFNVLSPSVIADNGQACKHAPQCVHLL